MLKLFIVLLFLAAIYVAIGVVLEIVDSGARGDTTSFYTLDWKAVLTWPAKLLK